MKIKKIFVLAICGIAMFSSFIVSANYDSKTIGNSSASITGSARMQDSSSTRDLCVMTGALGGSSKAAASGSVAGKIQGINVSAINLTKTTLNKNRYSYTAREDVKDDYCTFTVTITLNGVGSKNIYAHD